LRVGRCCDHIGASGKAKGKGSTVNLGRPEQTATTRLFNALEANDQDAAQAAMEDGASIEQAMMMKAQHGQKPGRDILEL